MRIGTTRKSEYSSIDFRRATTNPVPHPFAFFLAKGWDNTNPNRSHS